MKKKNKKKEKEKRKKEKWPSAQALVAQHA